MVAEKTNAHDPGLNVGKTLCDEYQKLLTFLTCFNDEEKQKIAVVLGISLSQNLSDASCLHALQDKEMVKKGKKT